MRATKRDYERVVCVIQALDKDTEKRKAWAEEIALILRESNPRFDRMRFIDAVLKDSA